MKKIMLTAAFVASLISFGYSQDNAEKPRKDGARTEKSGEKQRQEKTPEQRAQMATNALEKKLSLNADQKTQVYALNLERAQRMDKNMKAERQVDKDQMDKQKSFMIESEKKLNNILTEDQRKSYEEMKKQSREKNKGRRPQGKGKKGQ